MAIGVEVGAVGSERLKGKDAAGPYIFSVEQGLKAFFTIEA
jgi:hypothetical protein